MTDTLPNPTGAGYFNLPTYGGDELSFEIVAGSGSLVKGTLVEIVTPYTGPGTAPRAAVPFVQASATTADNKLVGVIVGGESANDGNGTAFPAGAVVKVRTIGVAQVLCDATTTAGSTLIQSTATAGCAKTGTAVTAQTVGIALQAVTISSGTALVWSLLKPS